MFRTKGEFASEIRRVALSVQSVIDEIVAAAGRHDSPFIQLVSIFDFAESVPAQIWACAEEMWDNGEALGEQPDFTQVGNLVGLVSSLEKALGEVRDALTSSSERSGFYWWLKHRQRELACDDLVVIMKRAGSAEFSVDTAGKLSMHFELLARDEIVTLPEEKLEALKLIRLITVPRFDGADPLWHPLTLGHELAHFRYDTNWITTWLANQKLVRYRDDAAKTAIRHAKAVLQGETGRSDWFSQLASWLSEVACDSTLSFFYRDQGVDCLEHLTTIAGRQDPTGSHPSPRIRCAVQRAAGSEDLSDFRVDDAGMLNWQQTVNGFCALGVALREAVHQDLTSRVYNEFVQISNETLELSLTALNEDQPGTAHAPPSQTWDRDVVRQCPSAVESGLVRALWVDTQFYNDPIDEPVRAARGTTLVAERGLAAYDERKSHIYRSVESLQFCHRFEQHRAEFAPSRDETVPNVLWISKSGVALRSGAKRMDCSSSHDVRLGRHFISFLRNRISTLSALDLGTPMSRTQEEVEVDWGDIFVLHPGEMVLGVTLEAFIVSGDATAQVLSRSSIGRLGLLSATAVHVQPGFRGCLTLELVNLSSVPLQLCPGQRIAQVVANEARGHDEPYFGKYQGAGWKPEHSAASLDWDAAVLSRIRRIDDELIRGTNPAH